MIAFDDKASREDSLELCLSNTMMFRGAMCNAYLKMPRPWETNKHLKYIINGRLTFNFGYLRATQCCTEGGGVGVCVCVCVCVGGGGGGGGLSFSSFNDKTFSFTRFYKFYAPPQTDFITSYEAV